MLACFQAVSDALHTNPLKTKLITLNFPGASMDMRQTITCSIQRLISQELSLVTAESSFCVLPHSANPSFGGRCPNQAQMPSLQQHGQEKFDDKTDLGRKVEFKVYKWPVFFMSKSQEATEDGKRKTERSTQKPSWHQEAPGESRSHVAGAWVGSWHLGSGGWVAEDSIVANSCVRLSHGQWQWKQQLL